MKYMYILLCLLSSFFTYNSLFAKEMEVKYAFFIPNNAFQENTSIKELKFPKKPQKSTSKKIDENHNTSSKPSTPTTASLKKIKKTLPVVINKLETTPQKNDNTLKPQNKYQLEENIDTKALVKKAELNQTEEQDDDEDKISPIERYKTEDIVDLLRSIPHPNPKLPKFKQLYTLYALELRTLYKHTKLPMNLEQEEILKKVNTIRRFEVE